MSATVTPVAINTFREAVRDRCSTTWVLFALIMMGAAILVGEISIGIERLVIINLGLTAISIFGAGHGDLHWRWTRLQGDRKADAV